MTTTQMPEAFSNQISHLIPKRFVVGIFLTPLTQEISEVDDVDP